MNFEVEQKAVTENLKMVLDEFREGVKRLARMFLNILNGLGGDVKLNVFCFKSIFYYLRLLLIT